MSALIHPKTITVDGLSVRYAEGGRDGPDAILMSPWPESVYAFEPAWPHLAPAAHLVAIDPPGFGGSDYRQTLMNPKAMGHFILKVADALGLDHPHIVGPDIGTSSVLFAAAADPNRFRSIVVGSGGAAVPLNVAGVLKDWIEASDLEPYRKIGGRKIVEIALSTIAGYTPSDEIREDYMSCYEGDRFADTIPYAQSYRKYLPELAKLLPGIQTPVRIVAGADDQVVPKSNAEFLGERLPNAQVDLIAGAGHFCWEEKPAEYAALLTSWWSRAKSGVENPNQRTRRNDSETIRARLMGNAERELAAFFAAVTGLFGSEQASLAATRWLERLETMKDLPASLHEWRSLTIEVAGGLLKDFAISYSSQETHTACIGRTECAPDLRA